MLPLFPHNDSLIYAFLISLILRIHFTISHLSILMIDLIVREKRKRKPRSREIRQEMNINHLVRKAPTPPAVSSPDFAN